MEDSKEEDGLIAYSKRTRRVRLIEQYAGQIFAAIASNPAHAVSNKQITMEMTIKMAIVLADAVIEATL